MGFPLGLVSAPKRYLVVHGLHCCRCAVAMLPPADVGIPLCVPLDAFQLQQTDTYRCQAAGLRFLNRRVALRILCAATTLAFSGTLHVCCRLAITWRFDILSHFSLVGVEDARQSLFWQLLVLVASTNSFHRLALNVSWLVHFGVSLMVAVRISAKRESVLFSYRHMFVMYIGK